MNIDDIKRVLVLGAGTMGRQIGYICALHGMEVVFYDVSEEILGQAGDYMPKMARRVAKCGLFESDDHDGAIGRISFTNQAEKAAEGVDIVSESVPEDPKLKGEILAMFNRLCPPETIFTTNTSSLLPSMFAEATGRPDKLCALHFHDVTKSKVVDVMPHAVTDPEITALVRSFAERIGQIPVMLEKEHGGYLFNHILMSMLTSALQLASNGVASVEDIDRSFMGILQTRVGPFGIMDSVGLETAWKITDLAAQRTGKKQMIMNADFLKHYLDQGKLGIKSGEGFYKYPNPKFLEKGFIE